MSKVTTIYVRERNFLQRNFLSMRCEGKSDTYKLFILVIHYKKYHYKLYFECFSLTIKT